MWHKSITGWVTVGTRAVVCEWYLFDQPGWRHARNTTQSHQLVRGIWLWTTPWWLSSPGHKAEFVAIHSVGADRPFSCYYRERLCCCVIYCICGLNRGSVLFNLPFVLQIRRSVRKKHTLPNFKVRYKPFFARAVPQDEHKPVSCGQGIICVVHCTWSSLSRKILQNSVDCYACCSCICSANSKARWKCSGRTE